MQSQQIISSSQPDLHGNDGAALVRENACWIAMRSAGKGSEAALASERRH